MEFKETVKNFSTSTTVIPGFVFAAVLSFAINKSVIWAILHMFCGWLYVIYWICTYSQIISRYIYPLMAP